MAIESRPQPDQPTRFDPPLPVEIHWRVQTIAHRPSRTGSCDRDPFRADRHRHDRQPKSRGLDRRRRLHNRRSRAHLGAKPQPAAKPGAAAAGAAPQGRRSASCSRTAPRPEGLAEA